MNSSSIISVNPTGTPSGKILKHQELLNSTVIDKPLRIFQSILRYILGVTGSREHSRRLWTFRVIVGSILMYFGILFSSGNLHAATDLILPDLSMIMIAGGAMIACGLLTRIISFALGIILLIAVFNAGVFTMAGFSIAVCCALCACSLVSGSGRYSFDTLIYNFFAR